MTETVLRIAASELRTVRIHCLACGAITELNVSKLAARFADSKCACEAKLFPNAKGNPVADFARLLEVIASNAETATVEFSLPVADRP